MDFFENVGKKEEMRELVYSLKLNNVYKDFFMGNYPIPNSKWLELSYITNDNEKLFMESI